MSTVEIENSPSRRDGIRLEDEKKKRRQTVSYIEECGKRLRLYDLSARTMWHRATATRLRRKLPVVVAETYLSRFYALQSFKKYDRFVRRSNIVRYGWYMWLRLQRKPAYSSRPKSKSRRFACEPLRRTVRIQLCSSQRADRRRVPFSEIRRQEGAVDT